MSIPLPRGPRPAAPSPASTALTFAWRAVLKFRHVPEQLFDLVMTPIMFTLLFTFILGGALAGSSTAYLQWLIPGILVQTTMFNTVYSGMGLTTYSGIGLSTDLSKGLFDRFRSLPIWSLAPFAGLMVGDMLPTPSRARSSSVSAWHWATAPRRGCRASSPHSRCYWRSASAGAGSSSCWGWWCARR